MAEEKKVISFRVDEATAEKIKELTEGFPNKETALQSMMNTYELQKEKAFLPQYSKRIQEFSNLANTMQSMYITALRWYGNIEVTTNARYERKLEELEKTIKDLRLQNEILRNETKKINELEQRNMILEKENHNLRETTQEIKDIKEIIQNIQNESAAAPATKTRRTKKKPTEPEQTKLE